MKQHDVNPNKVLRCRRSATFLPEVAREQGWSKAGCIDAIVRKAGELFS